MRTHCRIAPAASRKLWELLSRAELRYQLKGIPISTSAREMARTELGQARRVLLQVAGMGPRADEFMNRFLAELNEKERA